MQSLQSEYEDACSQLKLTRQQCRQLQGELDVERINASSKNDAAEFYHSLIQNIQAQIQGASRPGSASESQADGMSHEASAAVIGAVRQSIGAPSVLMPVQSVCAISSSMHLNACLRSLLRFLALNLSSSEPYDVCCLAMAPAMRAALFPPPCSPADSTTTMLSSHVTEGGSALQMPQASFGRAAATVHQRRCARNTANSHRTPSALWRKHLLTSSLPRTTST
jgi:hypothetical protein